MSCFLAQTIVKEYCTKTPGKRGQRHFMPFLAAHAMCSRLEAEDGQNYASANEKRLTRAGVMFKK